MSAPVLALGSMTPPLPFDGVVEVSNAWTHALRDATDLDIIRPSVRSRCVAQCEHEDKRIQTADKMSAEGQFCARRRVPPREWSLITVTAIGNCVYVYVT